MRVFCFQFGSGFFWGGCAREEEKGFGYSPM